MKDMKLTDEDLELLLGKLDECKSENDVELENMMKEIEEMDNSDAPLEEGEGVMVADGVIMEDNSSANFNHFENIDASVEKLITDSVKNTVSDEYNLSEDEAINFAMLISKVRNKEKVNVYEELPEVLKDQVKMVVGDNEIPGMARNQLLEGTARMLIDEFISDAAMNSLSIDLEEAMKELIPAPLEMYSETNREYIEDEFPKIAEKIKEENPKTADNLLKMRDGYIDAYTFEKMYKVFENNKVRKNIRRVDHIWSRICKEYYNVASVCKFNLYPLEEIHTALCSIGFTDTQAKRILTLFVATYTDGITNCRNEEEYNDIYRNAFANYFEINMKNLFLNKGLVSEFSQLIRDNLVDLCDHIDTEIALIEEELSNKKK